MPRRKRLQLELDMSTVLSTPTASASVAYHSAICIDHSRLTPQPITVSVSFGNHQLPPGLCTEDKIPLQITVSFPQELCHYIQPVISAKPSDVDRSPSELEFTSSDDMNTDCQMDITFLPLPSNFDYTHAECWRFLADKISDWLIEVIIEDGLPEWSWGLEAFWMAFIAAYPLFPKGEWLAWSVKIPMEGSFMQSWLDGSLHLDNDNFYNDLWLQFQQHVSLMYPQALIALESI